jgi:RNA polymerase sigma-70 factor (ECF subfamily)
VSSTAHTELLDHLFRHQAGRLVSRLTRLLGPARLDLAEEAVQEAMVRALQTWPYSGTPENAAGWLFRVAHNAALDTLRRRQTADDKAPALMAELARSAIAGHDAPGVEEQLRDDELRMIVMCCHPALSRDASVALSLKTAGGFSVREIARAFLADEAAIAQRLVRAKRQIRERQLTLEFPEGPELDERLDSVMDVIYFMFNEGYAAHESEDLIRHDLCMEAIRLGRLIAESSLTRPAVDALVALMVLQAARLASRVDERGDLVLLDFQDRAKWDDQLIALGFHYFDRSMQGSVVSTYHVQAAIAATHARAIDPSKTEWPLILELYDQLFAMDPSPVIALNRAVATGKVFGPEAALAAIDILGKDAKLKDYYLLPAVRAHLLVDLGRREEAAICYRTALEQRCSAPERRFLERKLAELSID